jgi:hypothetical protein
MASHGVVSTGVATPESFGFDNPETTPLSIPTNPATPPRMIEDMAVRKLNPHTQRSHIQSCKRFAAWLM